MKPMTNVITHEHLASLGANSNTIQKYKCTSSPAPHKLFLIDQSIYTRGDKKFRGLALLTLHHNSNFNDFYSFNTHTNAYKIASTLIEKKSENVV